MRFSRRIWPGLVIGLLLISTAASAVPRNAPRVGGKVQAAAAVRPTTVERITSVEGITEYRFANGLRVLLFPDPTKPTITVNLTVLVGSRQENYGEKGMAHLLEHMLFKGSPKHQNIPEELSEHGARPNGTTWFDRTNFFETFQATDENLRWALDLEADRLVNSFVAKKDLDTEMTVVRNEFEAGENLPQNILQQRVMSSAFLWHNYGHSTIGARSDIEDVPIERLQAFYHTFYQPDNVVLMVAGKIDEGKTLDLIQNTFGRIPKPTRELEPIYTVEPTQDGERLVELRRVGDVQVILAAYHVPAGAHPDFAAVDVLAQVLGDRPSGRLHKALVQSKKAASTFAFAYQLRDPSLVFFGAQLRMESPLDPARDELLKTIDALSTTPPTKEEIDRARQTLLKNIELNLTNSERIGLGISEWAAMGDWRLMFLHRDRLRKVTPEDVQRVASAYLKPSNRTLGVFIPTPKPDRAEIPGARNVAELLKDYKGDVNLAAGEAFDPSPANIETRVKRSALPNGLKLALLPKKTRGGVVVATGTIRYGDEKSLFGRGREGVMVAQMLMRGTSKHSRQQIKDEFDLLKARVNVFGGATQAGVSVETIGENLPAVLKLVAEVLREPSFPASEFEQLAQEQLAQIENFKDQPQPIAFNAFSRHLNPYPKGDVRYTATPEEQIEEIKGTTLGALKKFHSEFCGGSYAQFSVVGDFDATKVAKLFADLFGSWKSARPYTRVPSQYHSVPPIDRSFETPDKANAVFVTGMNLSLRDDDPDYPALVLGSYIFGSGMNSRLFRRIRQKEGLSYGVGSFISASSLDKAGSFMANAIYAPQNATKLEAAFKEEIERLLKDGVDADEVKIAKTGWLQSRQVTRAQDSSLSGMLSNYLFLNRTLAWDADLEKKVGDLTPEQISAALRKFLDAAKLTSIKAGDFAKTTAAK